MKKIMLMCLLLAPIILMNSVRAACSLGAGSPFTTPLNLTLPLQAGNLTVGPDAPNGTVIYRQTYRQSFSSGVFAECDMLGQFILERAMTSIPYPLSNWNGTPYPGQVYNTNIPGIGIAIWNAGQVFPFTVNVCIGVNKCGYGASYFTFDISLIKIGAISPGSLTGSSLPCISHRIGQAGALFPVVSACFGGAINIVSQTCTTPDVNVPMGVFEVSQTFRNIGSVTPWKDASVTLSACPRFYGTLNDGTNTFASDNGTSGIGTFTKNTINLKLTPNTAVIDSANGVIGLEPGTASATGIGIQLASGLVGDASPALVNLAAVISATKTMESSTSTTTRFPLVARYIQTGSTVSPGSANAAVTFTINYY